MGKAIQVVRPVASVTRAFETRRSRIALAIILILAAFASCRSEPPGNQGSGEGPGRAISSDTRHGPFDLVTRAELAVIVVKAVYGDPPTDYCSSQGPFGDVAFRMPSCPYIKKLKELESAKGIKTGYSDDTFRPGEHVTKEELAAFLVRAREGDPPSDTCRNGSPFPDVPTDSWSCAYIKRLSDIGLLKQGGKYYPSDTVTYAQVEKLTEKLFPRD